MTNVDMGSMAMAVTNAVTNMEKSNIVMANMEEKSRETNGTDTETSMGTCMETMNTKAIGTCMAMMDTKTMGTCMAMMDTKTIGTCMAMMDTKANGADMEMEVQGTFKANGANMEMEVR